MSSHLLCKYVKLKHTIIYFFLFAFYKCETLLFLLKEELKLRVFCNRWRAGYVDLKEVVGQKQILDKISWWNSAWFIIIAKCYPREHIKYNDNREGNWHAWTRRRIQELRWKSWRKKAARKDQDIDGMTALKKRFRRSWARIATSSGL